MEYSLSSGGKRVRPVLLLAACELAGGDTMEALPYAAALEFIHTYSLIHDDLPAMDDDDLRRGLPTNHKKFGDGMAILAGDGLLTSAFEIMNRDMLLFFDRPQELRKRLRAMYEIARAAGPRGMVGGQACDLEAINTSISGELLDFIHRNKTAALIRAAVVAGAYMAGADRKLIDKLEEYGENVGLAFQIADDILDVEGNADELGKATGHDKEIGKVTYPAVHGIEASKARLIELTDGAIAALSTYDMKSDFLIEMARSLAERTK
jgi:geranylgeranyl diphosphate synthase type II